MSLSRELNIGWDSNGRASSLFIKIDSEAEATDLVTQILCSLKHYFPDIQTSLLNFIKISPQNLLNSFDKLPTSTPDLPCNNFRRSYAGKSYISLINLLKIAFCDFYEQPYKDEIVWDIERIYFPNNLRELKLEDFSHLDHLTLLGSIQFSSYFTSLYVDSIKLTAEHVDVILSIIRRSHALQHINLLNCGITILSTTLPKISTFKKLILSECALSEKSIHHLSYGLYTSLIDKRTFFDLHTLILSKNTLKDDISELLNLLSLCNTLRVLDLSYASFHVDKLWPALKLGGLKLEILRLCGAHSNKKISAKDQTSLVVRDLFSSMVNLKELNLAATVIAPEILQNILSGIVNNDRLKDIYLNLDGACCVDKSCIAILQQHLPNCSISRLSLRDNNFEQDALKILPAIGQIQSLKFLDIGGANFYNLKNNKKFHTILNKVLAEIVKLICKDGMVLEELVLSDCRFGTYLSVILNALGTATIKTFDITNNELGNFGARLLSKALQLNNTITRLLIDRNQITIDGYAEIATSLKLNHTLTQISTPIIDMSEFLNKQQNERARLCSIINEIEMCLEYNRRMQFDTEQVECQKVIQTLNNSCDKYDVDNSSQKKIIFHNLTKSLAELSENSEDEFKVSREILLEQITLDIFKMSRETTANYIQNLKDILLKKGIEVMQNKEAVVSESDESIEIELKDSMNTMIENYLSKITWNKLFNLSDKLLTSKNGLRLCEKQFRNLNSIETSVHSRTGPGMIHRPHSSVLTESLIFTSSSLASVDNGLDSLNENAHIISSPLIHLSKNRPKPARLTKNNVKTTENGNYETITHPNNNAALNKSNNSFDSCESDRRSISPASGLFESSGTTISSGPPPLIPRRNKKSFDSTENGIQQIPPKLPPKPEESPKLRTTDLRNQRTLVLPTLANENAHNIF